MHAEMSLLVLKQRTDGRFNSEVSGIIKLGRNPVSIHSRGE